MRRVHVHVSGTVQGVTFRASTREQAEALGVDGWVRNRPDGRVEAVFEGEEDAVEQMLEFCREGPDAAQVDEIEVEEEAPDGIDGFTVRR